MRVNRARPLPPPDPSIEQMAARYFVLEATVAAHQQSIAELRTLAGLDPPPPILGLDWLVIKQAAWRIGKSETYVRKLIRQGRIEAVKRNSRWFVDARTLPGSR